jgi:hypothetical protein
MFPDRREAASTVMNVTDVACVRHPSYAGHMEQHRAQANACGDTKAERHTASKRAADAIARAQRLVDARGKGAYPLASSIEARHVGDLPAVVALLLCDAASEPIGFAKPS